MANSNPTRRKPSETHVSLSLRAYLPRDLADEIAALPRSEKSKVLGRWLLQGREIERRFEESVDKK